VPAERPTRERDVGIFVRCTEAEKKRIDRARHFTGRTLQGYILRAALEQVARDEAEMKRAR
jgi:uncharacterized protein (DUF1778 family)